MTAADLVVFLTRAALVALFLPFSAWYILADFRGARDHAMTLGIGRMAGAAMMIAALAIEVIASLAILSGLADRLAALVLATFCLTTGLLYKRFWAVGDFAFRSDSRALGTFWDFWKNVALAGGFLVLALGATSQEVERNLRLLLDQPFASTKPYDAKRPAS